MRWSQAHRRIERIARCAAVWTVSLLGGCNLVLGIDDVSSADGPDSGQRISASTADPGHGDASRPDAGADDDDDAGDEPATP